MNLPILMAQSAVTAEQVAARAAEQEQAFGAVVVFVLLIVVVFGYIVPFAIVLRHLFQLAGRPGRAAFMPVYNFIVLGDIAKAPGLAKVVIASMILSLIPIVIFGALPIFLITAALLVKKLFDQYDQTISFWMWLVFAPFIAVFKMKEVSFSGLLATPANAYVVPERQAPAVAVFGGAVTPGVVPPVQAAPVVSPLAPAPVSPLYVPPTPVTSPLMPNPPVAQPPLMPIIEADDDEGPLLPPAFTHAATSTPAETGPVYLPAPVIPEPVYPVTPEPQSNLEQAAAIPAMPAQPAMPMAPPGLMPLPPAAFVPSVEDAFMRPPISQPADPYAIAAQQDIAAALQAPTEPDLVYVSPEPVSDGVAPSITGIPLADLDALYGHNMPQPDLNLPPETPTTSDLVVPVPELAVEPDTAELIDPATLAPPVVMQPDMPVADAPPEVDEPIEPVVTKEPVLPIADPEPDHDTDYQDSDGVLHIDHHHDS